MGAPKYMYRSSYTPAEKAVFPTEPFPDDVETTASDIQPHDQQDATGADPGFFLGGGALVSCSTSTPINHIIFFTEYQLY